MPPDDNPLKAASLAYQPGDKQAPRLTAKGKGKVAEKILEVARLHNIPVHQDADLMQVLETVEIDTEIPLEVYHVVAEIFAFLYRANRQQASR